MSVDFTLIDHGSIAVITPLSDHAKTWVDDYISEESQWFGDGFVVEHRYVDDIVSAILGDDMEIRPITIKQVMH